MSKGIETKIINGRVHIDTSQFAKSILFRRPLFTEARYNNAFYSFFELELVYQLYEGNNRTVSELATQPPFYLESIVQISEREKQGRILISGKTKTNGYIGQSITFPEFFGYYAQKGDWMLIEPAKLNKTYVIRRSNEVL